MPGESLPDAAAADQAASNAEVGSGKAEGAGINYMALFLAHLGLDESADEATINAKSAELKDNAAKGAEAATLQTQLSEAQGKLAEIEKAKTMAEVDTLLADYEMPEESAKAMRELAVTNRPVMTSLLSAMPKKAAPAQPAEAKPAEAKPAEAKPAEAKPQGAPPAPMHDPKAITQPAANEEAIAKRARELWTSKKAKSWEEAKRLATKQLSATPT